MIDMAHLLSTFNWLEIHQCPHTSTCFDSRAAAFISVVILRYHHQQRMGEEENGEEESREAEQRQAIVLAE